MSQTADPLDIQAIVARIGRDQAESEKLNNEARKLAAEQFKLQAEQIKFSFEQLKLDSEARKLDRDRKLSPWLIAAGLTGGVVTVVNLLIQVIRAH